ncbi:kinase-like domain-containing protein [Fimicolochytrium jonesii]|uniref:kinase-like domain-containing protein n=1 Tax=Fimicolochytrium jonesii TaxID=1396493 RepID=UPI0022FEF778|nr:kinase-like domain-containing protein [Fimicolochytrium jonesii]KAI8819014.1 kinase-like domain-containing protein [Fimicolochytrium jonesii]
MLCLAASLHSLHALQPSVLHRDIRPENIFLDNHGRILCVDFGVARALTDSSIRSSYAGTEKYMAPEAGTRYARPAEVFSLAGVYAEILCIMLGYFPANSLDTEMANGAWKGRTARTKGLEWLSKEVTADTSLEPDLSLGPLLELIKTMLPIHPHERPKAGDVHDSLRAWRTDYVCCSAVLTNEHDDIVTPPSPEKGPSGSYARVYSS